MIRGFYSASSGLRAQQAGMDVAANNLANVNTVGFKPGRVSFTDLMYQNLNRATADNPAMVGHGVKVNTVDKNMQSGGPTPTSYPLDFYINQENGFFAVQTANGDIQYTRAGNFIMSDDGGTFYLSAPNGDRVLDVDGSEIELELDENNNPIVDASLIGVYSFANPYGLAQIGSNRFVETDTSGEAEAIEIPSIRNGYLESSAVEVSNEMVRIIESSKAFSFNSRMVQVADEVEQTINSMR